MDYEQLQQENAIWPWLDDGFYCDECETEFYCDEWDEWCDKHDRPLGECDDTCFE